MTLIEVLVVISVVGILVAVLLPAFRPARTPRGPNCVYHLRMIGFAFEVWAADHGGKFPMQVSTNSEGTRELVSAGSPLPHFVVISNELNSPKFLWCPKDSRRTPAVAIDSGRLKRANISYFVGVDAQHADSRMPLAGDDHLMVAGAALRGGLAEIVTNSALSWRKGKRHELNDGNLGGLIVMGDGSVRPVDTPGMQLLFDQTGMVTNRLAMP